MWTAKDFLNGVPVTEEMEWTVNKWDLVKLHRFVQQKAKTAEWKAAYRMGRKIYSVFTSDRESLSRPQNKLFF